MATLELVERGPEVRDAFLRTMAATFKPEAVRRKAMAWDWIFRRPIAKEVRPAFVLAAMDHGEMMGGAVVSHSTYQLGNLEVVAHSPFGINVHPNARGLGIRLVQAMFQLRTLLVGIPNDPRLVRVSERLGAISRPRWQTFKLLRAGSALARRKPWTGPLAVPADALWSAWQVGTALAGPRLGRNETITAETGFGADHAAFWDKARQNHCFIEVRDVGFMTWRYVEMPLQSYEILFLRRAGHVRGYVVLGTSIDPVKRTGQITDILTVERDERSLALLLNAAAQRLAALGAEIAAFGFTETPALMAAARRAGFLHSKRSRPAQVSHVDPAVRFLAERKRLYLTRGDQDEDY